MTKDAPNRYERNIKPPKYIVRGLNGVAVAQNGLILGEDGAMGSGKVSGYLRGLPDTT